MVSTRMSAIPLRPIWAWCGSRTEQVGRGRKSSQGQRHPLPPHRPQTKELRLWHGCGGPKSQVITPHHSIRLTVPSLCRSRRQFCLKRERLKWRKGYNRTIRGSLQLVVREIVLGGPEEDGEKEREKLRRLAGPNWASKPGWESRDNRLALMERRGGLVEYDSNIPHLIGENWAGNCEGIVHHEYDELNGMDLGGPGNKRRV